MEIQEVIDKLRMAIWECDWCYYVKDEPKVTDQAYDNLFKSLQKIEQAFPEYITDFSPTQCVGSGKEYKEHVEQEDILMCDTSKGKQQGSKGQEPKAPTG